MKVNVYLTTLGGLAPSQTIHIGKYETDELPQSLDSLPVKIELGGKTILKKEFPVSHIITEEKDRKYPYLADLPIIVLVY